MLKEFLVGGSDEMNEEWRKLIDNNSSEIASMFFIAAIALMLMVVVP
jgi:hypothetical protein